MKVAGYLRVSTDKQAEEGFGLDVQRQAIRTWAKAHGHRISAWYADEGVSGSNGIDTRDALPEALSAIKERRAAGLVVYKLDRLARDLVVQETLLSELRRLGAEVFSTSPAEAAYIGDDPDDPSRALIRQILGAVSQYERSVVRLRLRSGRRRKREKGGFAYGSPPLGYQAIAGELVPDEREQAVIARARELHAGGGSLRAIGDTLTAEGYQPKRDTTTRWHPTVIARMLKRP